MKSIYTGDISVVEDELIRLKNKLLDTIDVGSEYTCLGNIYGLNEIYSLVEGEEFLSFEEVSQIDIDKTNRASAFTDINENIFCDNFTENKELYKYIGCYGYNVIVNQMNKNKNVVEVLDFTEKEAYEIIRDYFKCCRSEDFEYFEYLIKNKRLINITNFSKLQKNIKGQCHYIYDDLPFIFIESPYFTLETISYLIHEFGHAMDFKYLGDKYSITEIEKSFFISGKGEVLPRFYERELLGFFEKEEIDNLCTACLLDNYYGTLEESLLEMYFFGMLSNDLLCDNKYYDIKKKKLLRSIDSRKLRKDFKREISFEYLDLSSSLKYSIGGIGGIMLYEEFLKDSNLGNEMFDKFLINRVRFADEKFLFDLGFSMDSFEEIVKKDYQFIRKYRK